MPSPESLVVDQAPQLNYERLCVAVQQAVQGHNSTAIQYEALAQLQTNRAQIAYPLNPKSHRPPSTEDRAKISGMGEITLACRPDTDDQSSTVRLGADLISVAIALSDELYINELDAAVLLIDARARAAHRPDRDVVAAAKELHALRRRESALYLQEVVRAGLLSTPADNTGNDAFLTLLMKERDILFVDHNLVSNLTSRLQDGYVAFRKLQEYRPGAYDPYLLHPGETLLLAECLFLLSYTVQFSSTEALSVWALLKEAADTFEKIYQQEKASLKSSRTTGISTAFGQDAQSLQDVDPIVAEKMSPQLVEAESIRNLLFLTWTSALDRSRYHDVYDPRTGLSGVNQLLKDLLFIPRTKNVPKLEEKEKDDVRNMNKCLAAAEVAGVVFRLAVADPDEGEAKMTYLRVVAYAGAMGFLGDDLPLWIKKRAGSLSPDKDLYADVLEDLALDVAEAPSLLTSIIQFANEEVQAAASEVAYASLDIVGTNFSKPVSSFSTRGKIEPMEYRRGSMHRNSLLPPPPGSPKRLSAAGSSLKGRPPKPPNMRANQRPQSMIEGGHRSSMGFDSDPFGMRTSQTRKEEPRLYSVTTDENVLAAVSKFIARAISLAPAKLVNDSIGGGIRYWTGVGGMATGFIPKVGDAVLDLWDACMRNAYAEGGVGNTFRGALDGFLELLSASSSKEGSPAHAAKALQYLCEGGSSIANMEKTIATMAMFQGYLSSKNNAEGSDLDEADSDTMRGVVNVITNAAEAMKDSGGIMPILESSGKDLAMHMASLARHHIDFSVKKSLLQAMKAMDNHRAIRLFLESVSSDKVAHLCRYIRGVEAQQGEYDVTIGVLELAKRSTNWGRDDFPEGAIESIALSFAVEEVLTFWSRRMYTSEAQRWRVVNEATSFLLAVISRQMSHPRSLKILSKLLSPAPGTGAASYALRSLVSTAGLRRASEEEEQNSEDRSSMVRSSGSGRDLYHISGRDSLTHAATHGLGDAYREMQRATKTAAKMVSIILSVPSGKLGGPGVVVAPAADLLLGEVSSLNAAASLVFSVDAFSPALFRAGYSSSVPAAVLEMLARAAHESDRIASVLGMDSPGMVGSASQFRACLSDIISRSSSQLALSKAQADPEEMKDEQKNHQEPSLVNSALRIVEASLGSDGGGVPGMFLLGLVFDATGQYISAEYGVLGALVEVVAGANDTSGRIDNRNRATSATFLERLAAHTVRSTSQAVLEHIKEVGASDPNVRGGGFADEMLFRIMEAMSMLESNRTSTEVDWLSLAELLAACLGLSALQVRIFPEYEQDRCNSRRITQEPARELSNMARFLLPSPTDLLHAISIIANSGELGISFEAFRAWYHLLGTRLRVHESNSGYANISTLFEITSVLLESLSSSGNERGLSVLTMKDSGETAAAAALLCITKIRDCENPNEPDSEQHLDSVQCGSLLGYILRAIAGISEVDSNTSRARTSLYVSLFICAKLSEKKVSTEAIGRAFSMKLGARRISGTEALIMAACTDAVSAPSAAAKSAAIAAASLATIMDPMRAIPALGAQNRLRRVTQEALANPDPQRLIARSCSRVTNTDEQSPESAAERAAIAVAEAAIALVHSVALSGHGARVLVDSGFVESAVALLTVINTNRHSNFRGDMTVARQRHSVGRGGNINVDHNGGASIRGTEDQVSNFGTQRAAMISVLTGAIAAAVGSTASLRGDAALYALEEGKELFIDLLRNVFLPGVRDLETISSLSIIVSRVPAELLAAAASASELRMILASTINAVVPYASSSMPLGETGSLLGAGISLRSPENTREARRMRISHPEGGSLFERDLIHARAKCMQNIFAALRQPSGLLFLFTPQLSESARMSPSVMNSRNQGSRRALGSLSEVLFVCRTMLHEVQRASDESMQMDTRLAADNATSISAQRLRHISAFCHEEFGTDSESFSGQAAIECLKKASIASKQHADTCISVFESAIFILREYIRTAREALRGHVVARVSTGRESYGNNAEGGSAMNKDEAEILLRDARNSVVAMCKDVEGMRDGVWGAHDMSFSKQVCRQIRTACTGRN